MNANFCKNCPYFDYIDPERKYKTCLWSNEVVISDKKLEKRVNELESIVDQQSKDIDELFDTLEVISMRGVIR